MNQNDKPDYQTFINVSVLENLLMLTWEAFEEQDDGFGTPVFQPSLYVMAATLILELSSARSFHANLTRHAEGESYSEYYPRETPIDTGYIPNTGELILVNAALVKQDHVAFKIIKTLIYKMV